MARFIDVQMSAEEDGAGGSVRDFLWVLFFFKVLTTIVIFWQMRTWIAGFVVGANIWYWFPVMGVMAAGPIMLRRRMLKQRARRKELLRSEWMIGPDEDDRALAAIMREQQSRG